MQRLGSVQVLLSLLAVTCLLAAGGCGFQLRGAGAAAEIDALYVSTARDTVAFDTLLVNLAAAGIDVRRSPIANAWRLMLLEQRERERAVSVTDRGLAVDFELLIEMRYQVEDADGALRIPATEATVTRVYRQDPDNLAGSSRERDLLLEEMHRDLAAQIVRALNAAVRRGSAGAGNATAPG
jgi:LPS-assembly lipoprotein